MLNSLPVSESNKEIFCTISKPLLLAHLVDLCLQVIDDLWRDMFS